MITIRPAQKGDGKTLLKMTRALAAHHKLSHMVKSKATDFERALFQPFAIIGALIAFDGEKPAGAAVWHRSFNTYGGKEIIYLEDLVVLPEFRGRGVAKSLMKALAKLALKRGVKMVWWVAYDWNKAATTLYRKYAKAHEIGGLSYYAIQGNKIAMLARRK